MGTTAPLPGPTISIQVDATQAHAALAKFEQRVKDVRGLARPFFARVTDLFNGRCTFFAVVFTAVGIILAFMGKLTTQYVALVGAIQTLLVAHSAKEDYSDHNSGGPDASV